ncbi:protein involved in detoxification of methylglyoxal [Escherichia coli]|uniref:Protein involved in detoxification of methylglyoxal n=1 Tax=Escherichia coli TaxID=562 RepID=A0A377C0I5_ECOLX|nr:protein involved in detoxification of methylglyoxal [Escherichia coli]
MRYLLTVIAFIMGFSALPVWAMNCYAEHEGGNTVVIGYVPRIAIPSDGKKGDKIWQSSEYFMNVFCNNALPPITRRRIPICMGKYNDVVSIRSGLL